MDMNRRNLIVAAGATIAATALTRRAGAQSFAFRPNQRYPDPSVEILDPSFAKYRLYSSTIEQVATGMRWAEGPVYFPEGGYLLCSDIPNNRIMKFNEKDSSFTVFRSPSNYAKGAIRERPGSYVA
jgi:gluconolactonase